MLAPVVSLALIGVAGVVIHRITQDIGIAEIRAATRAISPERVAIAIMFTGISFAALALLDPGRRLPARGGTSEVTAAALSRRKLLGGGAKSGEDGVAVLGDHLLRSGW